MPGDTLMKDALARGVALHRQGRIQDASAHYAAILRQVPDHVDALHMLGMAQFQLGHSEDALQLIGRALRLRPDPMMLANLAFVLNALKRHDEALRKCDEALALQTDNVAAILNRGVALASLKRFDAALPAFERAIALNPRRAEAFSNRGFTLASLGRYDEAVASCEQALALDPRCAEALNNRGIALAGLRHFDAALGSYAQALSLKPDYAEALYNRGIVLAEMKRFGDALESYDRALVLRPEHAEAHANRAGVLRDLKRYDEARRSSERALGLDPGLPYVLGACLSDRMQCCDWDDLGSACAGVLAAIERGERAANPFLIFPIPTTPAQQLRCARTYARDKFPAAAAFAGRAERSVHDRIRIGYFSPDFRDHAVAHLIAELIDRHDRARFEVVAFSFAPPAPDAWRTRLQSGFDRFLDVWERSDPEIVALAREHEIDIAVDLAGYTQGGRTGIFALRPAPVQVSYLGFPGTMGAPFIDYLIADPTLVPPEDRQHYEEKIIYLPHSYLANDTTKQISESTPGRVELGLPGDAFVFCCFNNAYKITPDVFDVWMQLMREVRKSVLWLRAGNPESSRNLCAEAEKRGVARDRLVFASRVPLPDHLARHRAADLFLDTFHYNAHTTASDALWAGLPVLTCLGQSFAGRVAASLLTAIGMPELITESRDEYASVALALATDRERLSAIRRQLAANRSVRPLFDTARYARYIEQAYSRIHERHQAGLAPDHIVVEA